VPTSHDQSAGPVGHIPRGVCDRDVLSEVEAFADLGELLGDLGLDEEAESDCGDQRSSEAEGKVWGRIMTRWRTLALPVPFLLLAAGGATGQPAAADKGDEAVAHDTTPPLMSLYLSIPLGVPGVERQSTGVFVPVNYRVGRTVDLVVFLRGYDINRPKAATSVAEYWNSPQHRVLKSFLLREEVNKSGKNVILAVPTLGPFAEAGNLKDDRGIRDFLDCILDGLWRSGPHAGLANRPTIRHLILAAHSGGGVPLRRLAQVLGDDDAFKDKLKECWGFDSMYGVKDKDAEFWADWAKGHPGTRVTMFYLFTEKDVGKDPKLPVSPSNPLDHREPTGTTFPATELDRLAKDRMLGNVKIVREPGASTISHNDVPRAHLANLVKEAAYLDER
jgi:hypothetical protein